MKVSGRSISRAVLVLFCALCLFLAACGGDRYADSKYTGTWAAVSAKYMEIELSQEEIGSFILTLDPDGSASIVNADGIKTGKWEEVQGGIRLDKDDDLILTDTDNRLVLEMDGVTFSFEKQQNAEVGTAEQQNAETGTEEQPNAETGTEEQQNAEAETEEQ